MLRPQRELLQAVRAGQLRAHVGALGHRQPDLRALRLVGHGNSLRPENRTPGGDVNPYLAVAAMIAAGLDGVDRELPLEPAYAGNAYEGDSRAARPGDCHSGTRSACGRAVSMRQRKRSDRKSWPITANYARVELAAFDAARSPTGSLQRGFGASLAGSPRTPSD